MIASRLPAAFSVFFALVAATMLEVACSSSDGDETTSKKNSQAPSAGPETSPASSPSTDVNASLPVPVFLLDPTLANSIRSRFTFDLSAAALDAIDVSASVRFNRFDATLKHIAETMSLFAKSSPLFPGGIVNVPNSTKRSVKRVTDPLPGKFIVVTYEDADTFTVETFVPGTTAGSQLLEASFRVTGASQNSPQISFKAFQEVEIIGEPQTLVSFGTYAVGDKRMAVNFGPLVPTFGAQRSQMNVDAATETYVQGVRIFGPRADLKTQGSAPRYARQNGEDGDVDMFAYLAKDPDAAGHPMTAEASAFIPAESEGDYDGREKEAFEETPLFKFGQAWLVREVRGTPNCASLGDTMRGKFEGTPPAVVGSLPKDLCLGAGTVAESTLLSAISAVCTLGSPFLLMIDVPASFKKGGLSAPYDVCAVKARYVDAFSNPQIFEDQGSGLVAVPASTQNASQKAHGEALMTRIASAPFLKIDALLQVAWPSTREKMTTQELADAAADAP